MHYYGYTWKKRRAWMKRIRLGITGFDMLDMKNVIRTRLMLDSEMSNNYYDRYKQNALEKWIDRHTPESPAIPIFVVFMIVVILYISSYIW